MEKGLDYSFGRPDLKVAWDDGYRFVCRYLSWEHANTIGKILYAPELEALQAQGFRVYLNWEYDARDALMSTSGGTGDATEAVRQAQALGYPQGATIYFSVDFQATDADMVAVDAYVRAAGAILHAAGYRIGVYGDIYVLRHLFDANLIDDGWQTYAWSDGAWEPRAALRQVQNGQTVGGASVDLDECWGITYGMGGTSTVATEKILDHPENKQDNGYFCGPASTEVALDIRGIHYPENALASRLGTTENGTNSIDDVTKVLNEYLGNIYASVFIPGQTASAAEQATLKDHLVRSIDAGFGLVANVVGTGRDTGGGTHSYSGGHYVAVVGYSSSGDLARVMDVAIGSDYWMTTSALAIWIAARGYTWAANAQASAPVQPATIAPGTPFPLTGNDVFGDINGPANVHGGDTRYDSPAIVAAVGGIQAALVAQGYAGQVSPGWVDCRFEQPTTDAVKALQAAKGLPQTGLVDAATWAALFPAPAPTPTPDPEPEPQPEPAPEQDVDVDALAAAVVAAFRPVLLTQDDVKAAVKAALKEGIL